MDIIDRLPVQGKTRREKLINVLVTLGRISLLIRLSRWLLLDGARHIYARGLGRSVVEFYASLKAVCLPSRFSMGRSMLTEGRYPACALSAVLKGQDCQ